MVCLPLLLSHGAKFPYPKRNNSMNDKSKYESIINLAHHTSSKHPQMSISDRASQFSPFAALTGYGAAIDETARYVSSQHDLDEDVRAAIDFQLQRVAERIADKPFVSLSYFKRDNRKDGGEYVTVEGHLKKIDEIEKTLQLTDGSIIEISTLLAIDVTYTEGSQ